MAHESFSDHFALPGADDIARWVAEHKRMGDAIKELQDKRIYLERLIAAAKGEASPAPISAPKRVDGKLKAGTWMHAVAEIVLQHPEGISYDGIRERMTGELGKSIKENATAKGFYGALRRLERDEIIVRHRGHAFTPAGFKRYSDKVERGEVEAVRGNDYSHSPIADAIKAYIGKHGPAKAAALRDHLSGIAQFAESMKNGSAIYNVLTRLVDRGELLHDRELAVFSLPNENGAPNDKVAGAPEAGEVGASPNENRSLFRLIG